MPGTLLVSGVVPPAPGTYVTIRNTGEAPIIQGARGVVAVALPSDWGPLGENVRCASLAQVTQAFGTNATVETLRQALRGGAREVIGRRVGTGGTAPKVDLNDTSVAPLPAVTVTALSPTPRAFSLTVRDAPSNPTLLREVQLFEDLTTELERWSFAKGTTGGGEPAKFVAAVAAQGSQYVGAAIKAGYVLTNKALADVTNAALAGYAAPTVDATAWSNALDGLAQASWNTFVPASNDTTIHAAVQAWLDELWQSGSWVSGVVGEPSSVALATREAHAAAFNDFALSYVGGGFTDSAGNALDGYPAAGWYAGLDAGQALEEGPTRAVVRGAADVLGGVAGLDVAGSINSGMVAFTKNAAGQVVVLAGVTTFVTPSAVYDAGWKKLHRRRIRFGLVNDITATADQEVGLVPNFLPTVDEPFPTGLQLLLSPGRKILKEYIRRGLVLEGATLDLDPLQASTADEVFLAVNGDDIDLAERIVFGFGFRYSP